MAIIFLLSVSAVTAKDNATNVGDNLKDITGDGDSVLISKSPKTFSDLYIKINNATGSEIYLDEDYRFNKDSDSNLTSGIYIKRSMTIYGNGSTIDGAGASRIFRVYDNIGDVVIKDMVFENGRYKYEGGAIYGNATIMNCIFNNNKGTDGGAIYGGGTAINCIFNNNTGNWGGASSLYNTINCTFTNNHAQTGAAVAYGNHINSSFINNHAEDYGGAAYATSTSFLGCTFTNNSASIGGAVYGKKASIANCTFISNSAEDLGGAIYRCTSKDCIFIDNHANQGGAIYAYGNTSVNCIFINNSAEDGGAAYNINATGCQFYSNSASQNGGAVFEGIVLNSTFTNNRAGKNGGAIYNSNVAYCLFEYNHADNGGAINGIIAVNSTFNHNSANTGGAVSNARVSTDSKFYNNTLNDTYNVIFFNRESLNSFSDLNALINTNESVIYLNKSYNYNFITDGDFKEGIIIDHPVTIYGGGFTLDGENSARIFHVKTNNVVFRDIVFQNANMSGYGGAFLGNATAINSTFKNNCAMHGGAIYSGNALNCTFIANRAIFGYGGAIIFTSAINCIFIDNGAFGGSGGAMIWGSALNCTFINNTANYGGAVHGSSVFNSVFISNSASEWGGAVYEAPVVNSVFISNFAPEGGAMYLGSADSCIFKTDSDNVCGTKILDPKLNVSNFTSKYNSGDKLFLNITSNAGLEIIGRNITVDIYEGDILITTLHFLSGDEWMVNLNAGTYSAVINASEYNLTSVIALKINKLATKIISSSVTTVYNGGKYLYVTLMDEFSAPIKSAKISIKINSAKTITTDKNGKAKLTTNAIAPKSSYTAAITFAGDTNHLKSTKSVKITVKKATPKLTAKAKAFKSTVKTKKYQIVLKTNKNKAMKKTKITLKVNGKTYYATTSSNGKAIFKITKLTKKGKYNAVIKYNGNKYYNAKKVNVKITVK